MGVTEALRIINTVSEYLRNINTGGPRCVRGVNAAAALEVIRQTVRGWYPNTHCASRRVTLAR